MMGMVEISGRDILPSPETSASVASMDSCVIGSGLNTRVSTNHAVNSMRMLNGNPSIDHSMNFISTPNRLSNRPTATMLQPLPVDTGVHGCWSEAHTNLL